MQAGSRAVFLRFAGCNLWSGREQDRATAQCSFCDTDFVGTDGEGGGKFAGRGRACAHVEALWGDGRGAAAGGDHRRRADAAARRALVDALHARGFRVAVETNGTLPATPGIDWLCVSPKAGTEVVQRAGDELKLVWPQAGDRSGRARGLGLRPFPGPADGLRRTRSGARGGDRAGDGAAEVAPEPAGAQGGRAALSLFGVEFAAIASDVGSAACGRRAAACSGAWRAGLVVGTVAAALARCRDSLPTIRSRRRRPCWRHRR